MKNTYICNPNAEIVVILCEHEGQLVFHAERKYFSEYTPRRAWNVYDAKDNSLIAEFQDELASVPGDFMLRKAEHLSDATQAHTRHLDIIAAGV